MSFRILKEKQRFQNPRSQTKAQRKRSPKAQEQTWGAGQHHKRRPKHSLGGKQRSAVPRHRGRRRSGDLRPGRRVRVLPRPHQQAPQQAEELPLPATRCRQSGGQLRGHADAGAEGAGKFGGPEKVPFAPGARSEL